MKKIGIAFTAMGLTLIAITAFAATAASRDGTANLPQTITLSTQISHITTTCHNPAECSEPIIIIVLDKSAAPGMVAITSVRVSVGELSVLANSNNSQKGAQDGANYSKGAMRQLSDFKLVASSNSAPNLPGQKTAEATYGSV